MRIRLFVFIVLFNTVSLFSQNKEIQFRHLDIQLSGYSVKAFVEDYKGFMWIGTSNGLNKYDGNNLSYYLHNATNKNSISNNGIMALYESKDSSLWIATMNGLNIYNRLKDNFVHYYHKNSKTKNIKINTITDITEDKSGNIWLATSGGICIVNKTDKSFETFEEHFGIPEKKYSSKMFNVLYQLKNGIFLAGNILGDIYEFNIENKTVKRFVLDNGNEHELDLHYITDICQTKNGKIWVSSTKTGLLRIDKIEDTHVWYEHFLYNPGNTYGLTSNNLLSLCVYNQNSLLIGTENSFLNILDINTNKFSYFSNKNENKYGIPQNSFWTIYKNKYNSYWIGTFSKGIYIVDNKPLSFKSYYHNGCSLKSLPDFPVTSFAEDNSENMWIGMDGGGLSYWNRAENIFYPAENIIKLSTNAKSKAVLCLYKTRELGIWAGFYKGGIIIIDNKNVKHLTIDDGLSNNSISSIVENKEGVIFIGTYGKGINFYNSKTKKIKIHSFSDSIHDLSSGDINVLYVDNKNRLFIGYRNEGFKIVEFESIDKFKTWHYVSDNNGKKSLSSNNIFAFAEDSYGNVWIATSNGLNKFDEQSNQFTVFRPEDNVLSNTIVGLISDNKGKLWLSTYNGIWSFDVKSEKFRQYTKADGIEKMRFNKRSSFYKNPEGEIYFGANGGYTSFYPDSVKIDTSENRLYITNFLLFNKPVKIGTENSPLEKQISETKKIVLKYDQSVFTLEYVAINYKTPEKINYAYKLENFEENWNYVGKKRSATYTNLNPGKYFFKLKSTNAAGDWCKQITVLEIEILPPFWKTPWFYASVVFLTLLIFYIFYTEKTRRITIQNQLLEEKVKNRTQQLKEVNTRLEEKNEEIFEQKEELHAQSEVLAQSNRELEQKTNELLLHQNKLEELVKIRTAELEKAKLKAENADRLKSAFLANMSHEIRTPMNAVVGFSQLLSVQNLDDKTKDSYIRQIQSNTDTLLLLIDDILDLSKIESGQISIQKTVFELSKLLQEVFDDNKVVHENNNVELRLNKIEKAKGIKINSDRKRIKQILMNLFNNARKFTESGFVELGFERDDNYLKFYVKDTGIGISQDELDEIFIRFKRIVDKRGKLFRGTGLGLSISQRLAHLLGGKIVVKSELDKGSVFMLILPEDIIVNL
jgi:signal transduction histidine kinase/ligand-binding sensor domain-containing protein